MGINIGWVVFQELKKHKVRDVVRVCEPSYKIEELKNEGINVTDLEFDDGTPPPVQVRSIYIIIQQEIPVLMLSLYCLNCFLELHICTAKILVYMIHNGLMKWLTIEAGFSIHISVKFFGITA
jgi:hypothetical protein